MGQYNCLKAPKIYCFPTEFYGRNDHPYFSGKVCSVLSLFLYFMVRLIINRRKKDIVKQQQVSKSEEKMRDLCQKKMTKRVQLKVKRGVAKHKSI